MFACAFWRLRDKFTVRRRTPNFLPPGTPPFNFRMPIIRQLCGSRNTQSRKGSGSETIWAEAGKENRREDHGEENQKKGGGVSVSAIEPRAHDVGAESAREDKAGKAKAIG
jgi:hypothetical protein